MGKGILKENPLFCNLIYIGRGLSMVSVAGEVVGPQAVYGNENNVIAGFLFPTAQAEINQGI